MGGQEKSAFPTIGIDSSGDNLVSFGLSGSTFKVLG
jgi:hypothetical protein